MEPTEIELARDAGRRVAREIMEFRGRALIGRSQAVMGAQSRTPGVLTTPPPELMAAVGGVGSSGTLLAEGDSWFDYPWTDVLRILEDDHGFDVESVAHKGDRIEEMAYSGGQLAELTRRLEKLLRRGEIPRAVLLSGGGNDIAGDDLAVLLNHANSAIPGLNPAVVEGVIGSRLRLAYVTILTAISELCQHRLGRLVPILIHGYDFAVPDGRGFWGGSWLLPGPWLEPSLRQKGYRDMDMARGLIRQLIDHFNSMLEDLVTEDGFEHVTFVDVRGTLSSGDDYEDWWDNELHPTRRGFRAVAQRFVARIPQ